jgi:coenzyme F420-reducing hydrogenase delta subunit
VSKTPFLHLWEARIMNNYTSSADVRVFFCRNATVGGKTPPALARLELRDGIVLERVPCGGRIDPRYLLKAFESGARAVCVLTCPVGHCKLMEGNLRATHRVDAVRELMAEAGLDSASLQIFLPEGPEDEQVNQAAEQLASFVDSQRQPAQGVTV